ncbi:uncharacterized protein BBA_10046 [Beauveria bassiana ARSEF 2860]|uniref:Uncharacterized protein n=1 Tax=Beauveria bassiana (strain ARSEF 2860) TaxID=655819 RepID=J4VQQ9_BEAB2|nr:uncharacterized protein BBA_10046 [Beauveria bassiana ARSEF 2860]EJP61010.1 hypothetical protein BBA_10046 [Beauveria bassiana ARSEF 2860]
MVLSSRVLGGLDRGVNQPVGFMGKIPDPSVRKVVREEIFKQLDTEYICPASTSDLSTGSCVSESSERDLRPGTDADARIDGSLGSVPRLFPRSLCLAGQATLFMAIVLTAMQVGLATESLGHNQAFRSASYGFTGFSVLRGLIAGPVIVLQFCATFLWNWMKALHRKGTPYSGVRSV